MKKKLMIVMSALFMQTTFAVPPADFDYSEALKNTFNYKMIEGFFSENPNSVVKLGEPRLISFDDLPEASKIEFVELCAQISIARGLVVMAVDAINTSNNKKINTYYFGSDNDLKTSKVCAFEKHLLN